MTASPKAALLRGAAWSVASRWAVKVIGFANTVVMARLLMPEDYGVVAMAMLVVGLAEALIDLGTGNVLLAKAEPTRADIDSCWTLRLLQFAGVGLLIVLVSWPAAHYFQEPRVTPVLWVVGLCLALAGAGNIGMVLAQREFNFSLGFKVAVIGKLVGVAVTVGFGFWLGDYRALVAGIAAGYLCGLVLSYTHHPYRPRWDTSRMGEIWKTSRWIVFSSLAGFVLRKGDEMAAARVGSTQEYGQYHVGSDLGQLPTGEVGPAMLRAFLPVLSSIQNDVPRMHAAVLKTIAAVNGLTLPIGLVFAVLAPQAVELLMGAKWLGAAQFVSLFALVSTLLIVFNPISTLLFLQGHAKYQTLLVWLEFTAFVLAALLLVPAAGLGLGILGLAWARLVGSTVHALLLLAMGQRLTGFAAGPVLRTVLRPLLGALLGAGAAYLVLLPLGDAAVIWRVLLPSAAATVVIVSWAFGSWRVSGRPEGLESTLVDFWQSRRQAAAG